jgi:hypothetical protein
MNTGKNRIYHWGATRDLGLQMTRELGKFGIVVAIRLRDPKKQSGGGQAPLGPAGGYFTWANRCPGKPHNL